MEKKSTQMLNYAVEKKTAIKHCLRKGSIIKRSKDKMIKVF